MSDEDAAADALLENFQREDLNQSRKPRRFRPAHLHVLGEVLKTLGVSETTLRRSLELLELPLFVQMS